MSIRALRLLSALLLLASLAACDEPSAREAFSPAAVEAMKGGDPVPEGAADVVFPWIGKQSVMCIGDAFERQVAFVDFSDDAAQEALGTATLAADGTGDARFVIPAAWIRTGHESRDEKLQSGAWLDAESHPTIVFRSTRLTRMAPTVWKVEGTWTMRGVEKPVAFLANVRYMPEMQNVGRDVVRVKLSFPLNLRDFQVGGSAIGSAAVAETWTVDMVVLGVMTRR